MLSMAQGELEGEAGHVTQNATQGASQIHHRMLEYGPGIIGGGSSPSDPVYDSRASAKRYSLEVGRQNHGQKKHTSVSNVDDRRSTLQKAEDEKTTSNVHGSDKKTKKVDSKSMKPCKDTLGDESDYHSDSTDRKERKRKRKEEKRLRKWGKRRKREERHRRKEERRAARQKSKHMVAEPTSDDLNDGCSDSQAEKEHKSNDKEDAESKQKKLEIPLREKALESLRAKKTTSNVHGSDKKTKKVDSKSMKSCKDTSGDESDYHSDSIDRKERKRKRKLEKRLRKGEKRCKREERHRRKGERCAAKQKVQTYGGRASIR